uniref:Purine nucleoside phosphorylase n=2 Tax=Candidatus Giovannoniibacteriota TaxID=1752738 RepID=A0A0G0ZJS2_9BACT|nr:MAG: hypothetical protein UV11_C0001G0019 [Candidatus Giovannonibacteria bacterium GW2011_GWF2_42_19]
MSMNFKVLDGYPNLKYGFSEKKDGLMKLFPDDRNSKNRERFFESKKIPSNRIVSADLVHGVNIEIVKNSDAAAIKPRTDGLTTSEPNLFLTITGADCFAVYFFDPKKKAIGIAHVGWRGLVGGIIMNMLSEMKKRFDSNSIDLMAAIGPGIRKCHFEVNSSDRAYYKGYPEFILDKGEKSNIDMPEIIKKQLTEGGLAEKNIEDYEECTYCLDKKYFSYRRDKSPKIEAQVAFIGLVK